MLFPQAAERVFDDLFRADFSAVKVAVFVDRDTFSCRRAGIVGVLVRVWDVMDHEAVDCAADVYASQVAPVETPGQI